MGKRLITICMLLIILANCFGITVFAENENFIILSSDKIPNDKMNISFIDVVMFGMVFCLAFFYAKTIITERRRLAKNPNLLIETYNQWISKGYTPAEFISAISQNPYLSYLVCLAELVNNGTIFFDDEFQCIMYPMTHSCNGYAVNVLQVLEDCRIKQLNTKLPYSSENGYWKLPISCFKKYLEQEKNCRYIEKVIDKVSPATRDITKEFEDFKVSPIRQALGKEFNTFSACMPKVKDTMPTVSFDVLINEYKNNSIVALYYYNNHYKSNINCDSLTNFAISAYKEIENSRSTD